MIRCPECMNLLKPYCSKLKKGKRIRYYKCDICGESFKTKIKVKIEEKIIKDEDYDK